MATNLDRRSVIDGISRRLKMLTEIARDEFLQSRPDIDPQDIVLSWVFENYPGFPPSSDGEIAPLRTIESWSNYDLENCSAALSHDLITVHAQLKSAKASLVDVKTKYNRKDYRELRKRLKAMVELAIGHEVLQRTGHVTNFLKSDPDPPNCFEWVFSYQYQSFPHTAISEFRQDDVEECHKAIDDGHLMVRCVEPPPERSQSSEATTIFLSREEMIKSVRETILSIIEAETGTLESFEDVPEILTQRSIIMHGLAWEISGTYSFPFGSPEDPNTKKLQCTNWSNPELQKILRALDTGDLRLIRVEDDDARAIPLQDRILRRRDRPRRNPRESVGDDPNAAFKRQRRSMPVDDDYVEVDDKSKGLSRGHSLRPVGSLDVENVENRDLELVNIISEELFNRRTALHLVLEEVKEKDQDIADLGRQVAKDIGRLQGVVNERDRQIQKLESQLRDAEQSRLQTLAADQIVKNGIQTGYGAAHDHRISNGDTPCSECQSHKSRITELEEKERRFGRRILDLLDRQSDLEMQLKIKSEELEKTTKAPLNQNARRSMSYKDEPLSDRLYSATPPPPNSPMPDSTMPDSTMPDSIIDDSQCPSPVDPPDKDIRRFLNVSEKAKQSRAGQGKTSIEVQIPSMNGRVGQSRQSFPGSFIRERFGITKDRLLFSSTKDFADWEQVLCIHPDTQPSAPKVSGESGTVYVVDSQPHGLKLGIYPTLRASDSIDSYSYLERYDVHSTRVLSTEYFRALPVSEQRRLAKGILATSWGVKLVKDLLANSAALSLFQGSSDEGKTGIITKLFLLDKLPLREYSLRFAFPSDPDYDSLCSAFAEFQASDNSLKRKSILESQGPTAKRPRPS